MYEHLKEMAKQMHLRRILSRKAILLVANRERLEEEETLPGTPLPVAATLAPQVLNQSVTLSVASLSIKADSVTLAVEKLEQRVDVGEPQVNLSLSPNINVSQPSINVEAPLITLPPMQPTFQAPKVEVNLPPAPETIPLPENFCPPEKTSPRKIVFTRDREGNIVSAKIEEVE